MMARGLSLEKAHPTAIVHPDARIHPSVVVGPYAVIEADVEVGENTIIGAHCVLNAGTRLGRRNRLHTGAVLGCEPQDNAYKGERSYTIVGDDNQIREYVQIARSTGLESATIVGDRCHLMSVTHIGHNCRIGSDVVMASQVGLAGHVRVDDGAQLGGQAGSHQFVRVGRLAMVGGQAGLAQDVPPFLLAAGAPASVYGINRIGLRRAGVPQEEIERLRRAFRILYQRGLSPKSAIPLIVDELGETGLIAELVEFVRASVSSKRGLISGVRREEA
jgi:UDP-N-acetylglucosamine acyltransferase